MDEIKILPREDWPPQLLEIPDPPVKLHLRGVLPPADCRWLSVVGSRKFTPYGQETCLKLIEDLRGYPVVIVSGLALGIDSLAHQAALSAGLKTVAVLGSGLADQAIYPPSHRGLARKILEKGGALLSEFEPDFRARPESFPQRNRIMAGLSQAVLVVEAEERSGTLITARLALEYNREVLAVPGSIFSANSAGSNKLIRLGAVPATEAADILEVLGLRAESKTQMAYDDASAEEQKILELLKTPLSRDQLIRQSGFSVSQANIVLSLMEVKGYIKESGGEIRLK